jgi:hypothetical protein
VSEIELATPAMASDVDGSLRAEGGEGDCVELGREDYERVRALVVRTAAASKKEPAPGPGAEAQAENPA